MKNIKVPLGRKFLAFVLCLISIIICSIFGKAESAFPFIVALFTAYVTGNVAQKATRKESKDGFNSSELNCN